MVVDVKVVHSKHRDGVPPTLATDEFFQPGSANAALVSLPHFQRYSVFSHSRLHTLHCGKSFTTDFGTVSHGMV